MGVHDASVGRPAERPLVVHPESTRVSRAATLGHVAGLGVAAGVEPIATTRGAVVAQLAEGIELLPSGSNELLGLLRVFRVLRRLEQVDECLAVNLFEALSQVRTERIAVVPINVEHGLWKGSALLFIERPHR